MVLYDVFFKAQNTNTLKRMYAILCALRGPDFSDLENLKFVFSGRIRYWIFGAFDVPAVNRDRKLKEEEVVGLVEDLQVAATEENGYMALYHYLQHVYSALVCLADDYLVGDDKKEAEALEDLAYKCIEIVQRYAPDKFNKDEVAKQLIKEYPQIMEVTKKE